MQGLVRHSGCRGRIPALLPKPVGQKERPSPIRRLSTGWASPASRSPALQESCKIPSSKPAGTTTPALRGTAKAGRTLRPACADPNGPNPAIVLRYGALVDGAFVEGGLLGVELLFWLHPANSAPMARPNNSTSENFLFIVFRKIARIAGKLKR